MLLRRWTPPSEVPTTPLDHHSTPQHQRAFLRWCKIIISALIPIILFSFCIVYTLQEETFFRTGYQHQQQDRYDQQQQLAFDAYIQDMSNTLLKILDENSRLHIRTKTLLILRTLETKRKQELILFLHNRKLIQNAQVNLRGADLNNVELICPSDLHHLHLPGVFWSNAILINCRLTSASFDQAHLSNARFINSTLRYASFVEANLDNSHFINTIVMNTTFKDASLIQSNFLRADVVQGNNFTNADLYQAKFTNDQWEGKKVATLKHDFYHARFPNGSFGMLNAEDNLVVNGNAELECLANEQTRWTTVKRNQTLSTVASETIFTNDSHWGNCTFVISAPTRAYQHINLHLYTLLIDTNNAAFSFLAFASCNQSYFEIDMYRLDDILHQSKVYSKPMDSNEIKSDNNHSMYLYGEYQYHLPPHTRNITIYFGIDTLIANSQCYFDNITFTVVQSSMNKSFDYPEH